MNRRDFLGLCAAGATPLVQPAHADAVKPRFVQDWGRRGSGEGEFDIPIGLAINGHDELFVTEFRNNRFQQFTAEGKLIRVVKTPIEQPGGIALGHDGRIYVAHLIPARITVYDSDGRHVGEFGRAGSGDGELQQPGGLAVGHDGSIYVADQVNHRIQVFDREGRFVRKWGAYGVAPGFFGGKSPESNRTSGPQFVAIGPRGEVYATEAAVGRIQKFTPEGHFLLCWGDNGTDPGGFGGRKTLPGPIAIVADRRGRIWVSATNHWVQQFTANGAYLQRFGGEGTDLGQFRTPHGLAVDSEGFLYVCDTQNARIQKFQVESAG